MAGGGHPKVPREERIRIYEELASLLDQAEHLAEALQLPRWERRCRGYGRHAHQARIERDYLEQVLQRDGRAQAAIKQKRAREQARRDRAADALVTPGGCNSRAYQLLYGTKDET